VISPAEIQHWRNRVPWTADDQVEQDLILARLMTEIANDPSLGNELVMRGGTCFHMLWLDRAWRYSEDLDYVRRSEGPIGPILDALRSIGERVGFDKTSTAVGRHPKAHMHSTFASGNRLRVKVEMNTFERSPALPTTTRTLTVDNPWFTGSAEIPTFAVEELTATKIRAIYQRSKGRDLFDLWLAVHLAGVKPTAIAHAFGPYRPDGWTPALALANLEAKLADQTFTTDIDGLLVNRPDGYDAASAAETFRTVISAIKEAA
jgi:predicted nucleotidyltransferase component of viral defense system